MLLPRYQFRHAPFLNGLVIMQHSQRWKRMQQLIRLKQEHGVAGSPIKTLLLRGVGLVDQMSAWLDGRGQNREEFALQKEKDHNQIVLFPANVLHGIQIANLSCNR